MAENTDPNKVTKPVVNNPDTLSGAHDYEKATKKNKKQFWWKGVISDKK